MDHHHAAVPGWTVNTEVTLNMKLLTNLHVLVLGLGDSGLAMVRWCAMQGAQVTVVDNREQPPGLASLQNEGIAATFIHGNFDAALMDDHSIKAVFKSPGLSPEQVQAVWTAAKQRGLWLGTELSLFTHALSHLAAGRDYRPHIVAITGTNGKTTVTTLTSLLLKSAGMHVAMAGNIGPSLLDTLRDNLDNLPKAWVLELSSFQLDDEDTFEPTAACILNLTQDHLDWHADMHSYGKAKSHIYGKQAVAIMPRGDDVVAGLLPKDAAKKKTELRRIMTFGVDMPQVAGDYGLENVNGMTWLVKAAAPETEGKRLVDEDLWIQRLMPADALRLRGQHNALNALAALALASSCGASLAPMLHALREYRGEPHRMQSIGVVNDIEYIDDSKGTNVGATLAAVQSLGIDKKLILILGGDGKGQDFSPLRQVINRCVRAVVLMGKDAPRIEQAVSGLGITVLHAVDMQAAVHTASQHAQTADIVLLSPACSSLDMFKNYAERGSQFEACVQGLILEVGHA